MATPVWAVKELHREKQDLGIVGADGQQVSEHEKLRRVLTILQMQEKQFEDAEGWLQVQGNAAVKKHLLHLYDVLELYKLDWNAESDSVKKKNQKLLLDLFHIITDGNQKYDGIDKRKQTRNRMFYALQIFWFLVHVAGLALATMTAVNTPDGMSLEPGYASSGVGLVQAFVEYKSGNYAMALGIGVSSLQLLVMTATTQIAANTGLIAAYIAAGSMAASMAVMMFGAGIAEYVQANRCSARIKKLEGKLTSLEAEYQQIKSDKGEAHEDTVAALDAVTHYQHMIMIEKAKRADHMRHAKAWAYSGLAMTVMAVIAFTALGSLSFGAVPAAAVAVGLVAVAVNMVRKYYSNKIKHVDEAHDAKSNNLIERLMKLESSLTFSCGKTINLNATIHEPGCFGMFSKSVTVKDYLTEMMHRDGSMAKDLIGKLENASKAGLTELKTLLEKDHKWSGRGKMLTEKFLDHVDSIIGVAKDESDSFGFGAPGAFGQE